MHTPVCPCPVITSHVQASPLSNLSLLRQRRSDNLVAVQQAKRVKRLLELSHCIDSCLANFVGKIVSLHQANTVFTRSCAFEFNSAFDHFMNKMGCLFVVTVAVVKDDCYAL